MSLPWDTPATTNLDTTTTKKKTKKNTMSEDAPVLTKKQRAAALLKESTKSVIKEAFYMKRAMDQEDVRLALKHASQMLGELRTSLLSPMNYYELYMKVCDELMYLEMFFREQTESGKQDVVALYQRVQNCGNVLPRLYLLFCVGGIYIKSKKSVCKDILKDMVEMGKGVQHPMRGLFLRNYLSTVSKDKLPDLGSEYEAAEGGNTDDAVEFVLQNFCEMYVVFFTCQCFLPVFHPRPLSLSFRVFFTNSYCNT